MNCCFNNSNFSFNGNWSGSIRYNNLCIVLRKIWSEAYINIVYEIVSKTWKIVAEGRTLCSPCRIFHFLVICLAELPVMNVL
jgi:hypothetical protein